MGKQYNKIQKRYRREAYLERKKTRTRKKAPPKLRYSPRRLPSPGDPFDKSDILAKPGEGIDPERGERLDKLLAWLSAAGNGTWRRFADACDTLQLTSPEFPARSILRQLLLLGHLEVSPDGQEWTIAPSVCVTSATELSVRFLAGARTARSLGLCADPEFGQAQPEFSGPSRIQLSEGSEVPPGYVMVGKSALKLAEHLPDLDGWKYKLQRIDRVSSASFTIEHWHGDYFQPCVFIAAPGPHQSPTGLYRLSRGEGDSMRRFHWFFDAGTGEWRQGDWYGLRFLARQEHGAKPVIYDLANTRLFVPASERWPLIYERALVLASGFLPARDAGAQQLHYETVPRHLAQMLARKLNLALEERTHA